MRLIKISQIVLAVLLMTILSSCASNNNSIAVELGTSPSATPLLNVIKPYEPTPEEQMLIKLIDPASNVNIFSFSADSFKSLSVSYKQYQKGALTYSSNPLKYALDSQFDKAGKIAIVLDENEIKISVQTPTGGATNSRELSKSINEPVSGGYKKLRQNCGRCFTRSNPVLRLNQD